MKASYLITLLLAGLLYACGNAENSHNMNSSSTGININPEMLGDNTIDPICKMDMTRSKIVDTLTYNGKLYAFCNTGCKDEFQANPEKYLK
jgi:YHS domain-containing protein